MAHKFSWGDGAERQVPWATKNFWKSIDGSPTISTTTKFGRGSASWRFNPSNAKMSGAFTNAGYADNDGGWNAQNATGSAWVSCHIRIDTLPGSSQYFYLARTRSATLDRWSARLRSDGKIELGAEGSYDSPSANALSTGVWYQMSMYLPAPSSTAGTLTVRDSAGTSVISLSKNTSGTGDSLFSFMCWAASYGDVYIDNIIIESGASANIDDPYNQLGYNYGEQVLVPTGAGTANTWTTGTYADIDDGAPFNTDDYLTNTGTTAVGGTFACGDFNTNQIGSPLVSPTWVMVSAILYISSDANTCNGGSRTRFTSTNRDSLNYDMSVFGTATYGQTARTFITNPETSSDFTVSDINATEIGAWRSTCVTSREVRCTAVYMSIWGTELPAGGMISWF